MPRKTINLKRIAIFINFVLVSMSIYFYIGQLHSDPPINIMMQSSASNIVYLDHSHYTIPCNIDEWSCTLTTTVYAKTEIKTCWNKLSPIFNRGIHYIGFKPFSDPNMKYFSFDCEAHLKNITLYEYNNYNPSYVIFNAWCSDKSFQLFLNNKPLKLNKQTSAYGWIYSEPIPISFDTNQDDIIRYIYSVKNDNWKDLKFNFIPLDANKNILSSAIWSLPTIGGMQNIQCNQLPKYNSEIDWRPCVDNIDFQNCIVYSIGVSNENKFDIEMGKRGCKVYSFDCTISYPHNMSDNVLFYPWCVGSHFGNEEYTLDFKTVKNSKLMSIINIIDHLKHSDESVKIDVLKIDCEGCEWSLLNDLIKYENGKYIKQNKFKQLLIEIHATNFLIKQSHLTLQEIYNLFEDYKHFKLYEANINPGHYTAQTLSNETLSEGFLNGVCCYEYHMTL
eukprot:449551_1